MKKMSHFSHQRSLATEITTFYLENNGLIIATAGFQYFITLLVGRQKWHPSCKNSSAIIKGSAFGFEGLWNARPNPG